MIGSGTKWHEGLPTATIEDIQRVVTYRRAILYDSLLGPSDPEYIGSELIVARLIEPHVAVVNIEHRRTMEPAKTAVKDFWEEASCGENLLLSNTERDGYLKQASQRYALEPEIIKFAEFPRWRDCRVLEVGVGLGADHQCFAESGAVLSGVDLTQRAIDHTARRFQLLGLKSDLRRADAENLPFADGTFDLVYAWGVLMVSPDTAKAIQEVRRVLKQGGTAKVMLYHKYSLVGYMLWLRYGLLRFRPFTSLTTIYHRHLESPGMKAYSIREARGLFEPCFKSIRIETTLTHGDLLTSRAGQRHEGFLLGLARRIWPRAILRRLLVGHGLFMMIEASTT